MLGQSGWFYKGYDMAITLNGTTGITTPALDSEGNLEYSGTLTGSTSIINIGSGQVYKDASGNVGIGTSSPGSKLDVTGDIKVSGQLTAGASGSVFSPLVSAGYISGTSNMYLRNISGTNRIDSYNDPITATIPLQLNASQHTFYIADAEKVRIDSAGNVGIGTSSPVRALHVEAGGVNNIAGVFKSALTAPNCVIAFSDPNSTQGDFSTRIGSIGDGLAFFTNGANARMRIDASGNVFIGTTSFTGLLNMSQTAGDWVIVENSTFAGTQYFNSFRYSSTEIGTITGNNTSTAYNTTSDYRLKHDIQPMTGALAKVAALKPCTYKWNADDSSGEGFIAHELQAVVPDAVTGEKDAVDKDGKPIHQGVDTSFLVATLTAALQELKAELDTVKAELNTLKGN